VPCAVSRLRASPGASCRAVRRPLRAHCLLDRQGRAHKARHAAAFRDGRLAAFRHRHLTLADLARRARGTGVAGERFRRSHTPPHPEVRSAEGASLEGGIQKGLEGVVRGSRFAFREHLTMREVGGLRRLPRRRAKVEGPSPSRSQNDRRPSPQGGGCAPAPLWPFPLSNSPPIEVEPARLRFHDTQIGQARSEWGESRAGGKR
jgi:hypothetical protein